VPPADNTAKEKALIKKKITNSRQLKPVVK
jgi:hypothetical protein